MDRLESMRLFVAVAEQQSFAAAARRLGQSAARVTRAVAALEQHLGVRLLHRTTRAVRLSEAGSAYLASAKQILSAIEEADAQAGSAQRDPTGQLTITAPLLFGRLHVAPVLIGFMKRYPRVSVRALFGDQVIDLVEQQVDVAVRIAELADSTLHVRRVGSVRRVVCASPAYLRAAGTPRHPRELKGHQTIAFSELGQRRAWTFAAEGKREHIEPPARLWVNASDTAIAASVAGLGLCRVLSYQVASAVAAKQLTIVLAAHELPAVPVQVVHVEGRQAPARVRAFVDYAVKALRASLGQ
jgi:DNA-binding transcriptional LysR family regulator